MTAMDGDGIDEELTRVVSVAMLAAARAGEQFARMNQAVAQERQARSAGHTEQAQRELDAHVEAARAYFEVIARTEYTGAATDEQLLEVIRQALAWRELLPEAQRAEDAATTELSARGSGAADLDRATVLASEADAAARRGDPPTPNEQRSYTIGEPDPLDGDGTPTQRAVLASQNAVATARTAQALPAREALRAGSQAARGLRSARAAVSVDTDTGVQL